MAGVRGDQWGANVYLDPSIDIGAIPYKGANGQLLWLTPGAAAQVLTSTGLTPGIPNYQAPAAGGGGSGGSGPLASVTITSSTAQVDITTRTAGGALFQSDFGAYDVVVRSAMPVTDGASFLMQVAVAGTVDTATNYGDAAVRSIATDNASAGTNTGRTSIRLDGGNGVDFVSNTVKRGGLSGTYRLYNPLSTTTDKVIAGISAMIVAASGQQEVSLIRGAYQPSTPVALSGLRFLFHTGNIASAVIEIYGVGGSGGGSSGGAFGATGPRTTPPSSGWSWFQQRGSTVATSSRDGSIHLSVPAGAAGASTVLTARMRAAPSTPYTVIANLQGILYAANYVSYGLAFGNAGSEIRVLYFGYVDGNLNWYVAPTTSGGQAGSASFGAFTTRDTPTFMAIRDDGTNKKYYIGWEEENMMELYSEARATQFTPTEVGFYSGPRNNTYGSRVTLWSWKEQSAAPAT